MKNKFYSISVLGLGHVGLITAVTLAHKGFRVYGIDTNENIINQLQQSKTVIYEPNLQKLLIESIKNNLFIPTSTFKKPIIESELSFITVGTPNNVDGSINLNNIFSVSETLGKHIKNKTTPHLVVIKSTIIPGTTQNIVKIIEKHSNKKCGVDWNICVNPEFLREGSAIYDNLNPDKIVIGGYNKYTNTLLESFYNDVHSDNVPPIIKTSPSNAELIKYINNVFLASKISFINNISNLCQKIPDTDINIISEALGHDKRISSSFLNAGIGWGGSCFKKDINALLSFAKTLNLELPLIEASLKINQNQPLEILKLAYESLGSLKGKKISVLGLAFKPNTDDMREANSISIINKMVAEGAIVTVHDPKAIKNAKKIFKDKILYAETPGTCIKNADCCLILTEWQEYINFKPEFFLEYMKNPLVIDGRRIYDPEKFCSIKYVAIGLGKKIK